MLLKILGIILGFIVMAASFLGLIRQEPAVPDMPEPVEVFQTEEPTEPAVQKSGNTLHFGDRYSISLPEGMQIADAQEGTVILGYCENSGQSLTLQSFVPEEPLSLSDLEQIFGESLEDPAFHAAGDFVYLSAYDPEYETDLCIFTAPDTGEVYIIGLGGFQPDFPASQVFQTLSEEG